MKKIIAFLLMTIIVISSITATQAELINSVNKQTEGDWSHTIKADGTAEINGYIGNESRVSLPEKLDNAVVTSIGCAAFYDCKFLEVTLPSTLKEIGWWSFYGCDELEKVNFNYGLNKIEFGAFINCKKLRSVDLPVTVYEIGNDAFAVNCYSIKDLKDSYSDRIISKQNYSKVTDFKITGFSDTFSEKYASENELDFISKGKASFCDVDLSGEINKKDVELIDAYLKGDKSLSKEQLINADINADCSVTAEDASLINNYISNVIDYSDLPVCSNLQDTNNFLSGMNMYCNGDSIAKGTGTNIMGNDFYSYCNYISETFGVKMVNKAVPGTTIAKQEDKTEPLNRSILERVQELNGDYDIILLDGGFNDLFQKIEIGEVTPNSDKSGIYDEYTTAGALESICYFLDKNYNDSLKLFVLGHTRFRNERQEEYWSVIRTVLEKWNYDYIDLSRETELCDVNDEIVTQYFMYKERYKMGDGVHPLEYTNRKIYGPYVAEKLNKMAESRLNLNFNESDINLGIFEEFSAFPFLNTDEFVNDLSWYSENPEIAYVDERGQVVAKGLGSVIIRAESKLGLTASYRVNVNLMSMALKLNVTEKTLNVSEKFQLKSSILNGTASYHKYFTSSNPDVAYVDYETGEITALSQGTSVITCKTYCGAKASCIINVKQNNIPLNSEKASV